MLLVPASSRVNLLPQVQCLPQGMRNPCGSGFTREEASENLNQSPVYSHPLVQVSWMRTFDSSGINGLT